MRINGLYFYTRIQKNFLTVGKSKTEGSRKDFSPVGSDATPFNSEQDVKESRDEYSVSLGFGGVF